MFPEPYPRTTTARHLFGATGETIKRMLVRFLRWHWHSGLVTKFVTLLLVVPIARLALAQIPMLGVAAQDEFWKFGTVVFLLYTAAATVFVAGGGR